jgi:hypothetical protein
MTSALAPENAVSSRGFRGIVVATAAAKAREPFVAVSVFPATGHPFPSPRAWAARLGVVEITFGYAPFLCRRNFRIDRVFIGGLQQSAKT